MPLIARILCLNAGISKNAVSGFPSTKRAIDIDQYGMPAAKFVVPSNGSTTQYSEDSGTVDDPSSLRTSSFSVICDSPFTIVMSLHRSHVVIKLPSAFSSAVVLPKSFSCLVATVSRS